MMIRLLLVCVFSSLLLRFFQIGSQSYWLDEMVSVNFSMFPSYSALFWDNHPILYHLLLKYWISLTNPYEMATRSLSALFSVAATGLIFWKLQKWKGTKFAFVASLVHTLCSLSILYAQETRMYALFEFLATWQILNWWESRQPNRPHKKLWSSWLPVLLMCATHYAAVIPLTLQNLLQTYRNKKVTLELVAEWMAGLGIIFGSYLISFSWFHLDWQKLKFRVEPNSRHPWEFFNLLTSESIIFQIAILLLICVLLFRKRLMSFARQYSELLFIFLASVGGLWLASHVFERSLLLPRYLIFLVPVFALLVAGLVTELVDHWPTKESFKWAFIGLFVLTLTPNLKNNFLLKKAPWRDALRHVIGTPNSKLYTTRTLALRYPYLIAEGREAYAPKVTEAGLRQTLEDFKSFDNLLFLENTFGALSYFQDFKEILKKNGIPYGELTFKTSDSEPIYLLHLQKPTSK